MLLVFTTFIIFNEIEIGDDDCFSPNFIENLLKKKNICNPTISTKPNL